MRTIAVVVSVVVFAGAGCKGKQKDAGAGSAAAGSAGSGSALTGSAAGSAAPESAVGTGSGSGSGSGSTETESGSAAGSASGSTGSGSASAAESATREGVDGCGPNTYASETPPLCIDFPAAYREGFWRWENPTEEMVLVVDDGEKRLAVGTVSGADLAAAVKSAKSSADEFAEGAVKQEDLPDGGKAFTYQTCDAAASTCYDTITVVKRFGNVNYSCEAYSQQKPDPTFLALCRTIRSR